VALEATVNCVAVPVLPGYKMWAQGRAWGDAICGDAICGDAICEDAICGDAICGDAICGDAINRVSTRGTRREQLRRDEAVLLEGGCKMLGVR
jgi:hypothetical protein